MTTLASRTRRLAASVIAAATVVSMIAGCSTDAPDDQVTSASEEAHVYADQFTVGSATFNTDLPEGARAFELTAADSRALFGVEEESIYIVSWPGHDLSTISFTDFIRSVDNDRATTNKMVNEAVTWHLWPIDCMGFDTAQNRDSSIDSTSPLNGQPVTYTRATDLSKEVGDKSLGTAGIQARTSDMSAAFFVLKLDTKPCGAVMSLAQYARTSPDNPLKDFGYRLFVEGDGTVTTTNP